MSQLSGASQSAPSGQARRPATPSPARSLRWLPAFVALLVSSLGIALGSASCVADEHLKPSGTGPGNQNTTSGGCVGPTCEELCAKHPMAGCSCKVEGQHLLCSKAEASFPGEGTSKGATVCGTGFSVCTGGVWGDCQLDGSVTIVPNAPPGYYADNFGTGTSCVTNPCDPACKDFIDTPKGVSGPGLSSSDAGVTIFGSSTSCVPKSCATLGFNCGTQSDGCGNTINCGTCTFPQTCGGGGKPSVCGLGNGCTNLCLHQVQCSGGGTTSISGTVYMPNGVTPLPNVLVYVPNTPLSAFTQNTACVTAGNCTAEVSGSPLVATTSAIDGTFLLKNVPAGVSFPVVLQLGRFRREFTMPAVTMCTNAAVPCTSPQACLSRFPQKENETTAFDNIPKMAFITGCVDALECVWQKVGIASTGAPGLGGTNYGTGEFTPGLTNGRINFYAGSGCPGTYINDIGFTTPWDSTLLGNPATLSDYDILLFPCQGAEYYYGGSQIPFETNVANFANAGGRVFSTHYSYIWIVSDPGWGAGPYSSALSGAINWDLNASYGGSDPTTGYINTGFPGGQTLASWLMVPAVGASTTYGQMSINTIRHDFDSVNPPTQLYVSLGPEACTNTSADPNNCGGCGQNCAAGQVCSAGTCAGACSGGLVSCSGSCTNVAGDVQNCGTCGNACGPGQTCSGGVCTCPSGTTPCGGACVVTSSDPHNCGSCGNACSSGATCTSGSCQCAAGLTKCGNACVLTAADPNNCGSCGHVCSGASNRCHAGTCTSSTCGSFAGYSNCTVGSGRACENSTTFAQDPAHCGSCNVACAAGQVCTSGACTGGAVTCGGGLTNCSGTCTNPSNDPNNCGACGNGCAAGDTCVSGVCTCGGVQCGQGIPQQASFNTPLGTAANSQCGRVVFSDFHVESSNDSQFPFPSECGGGGFSPQEFMLAQALFDLAGCVNINPQPACVPVTCGYLGLNCGTAGDGCGNTINCGACTSPQTCGGGGVPGVCGTPQTFSPATFVRDYDASTVCNMAAGETPVWRLFSWGSVTPKDSHIDFSVATATSLTGLGTATTYALDWSSPPGIPATYSASQQASAHAVNVPSAGKPDTEIGSTSPDATLLANKLSQANFYLRVIANLQPSSDALSAPTLASWDMQIDCLPKE